MTLDLIVLWANLQFLFQFNLQFLFQFFFQFLFWFLFQINFQFRFQFLFEFQQSQHRKCLGPDSSPTVLWVTSHLSPSIYRIKSNLYLNYYSDQDEGLLGQEKGNSLPSCSHSVSRDIIKMKNWHHKSGKVHPHHRVHRFPASVCGYGFIEWEFNRFSVSKGSLGFSDLLGE